MATTRVIVNTFTEFGLERLVGVADVEALRAQGYAPALDDFAFEARRTGFLPFADYVKLDMIGVDPAVLADRVLRCRELGVKTIAERVSSEAAMELATGTWPPSSAAGWRCSTSPHRQRPRQAEGSYQGP